MNTPAAASSAVLHWPAEALWQALAPVMPGFTVEVLPDIDSTNSELMRRARAGCCDPLLLVAEHQSAGRGRMGKHWHSPSAGQALTFSLGLPLAPLEWSGLSLVVGLTLAQSLHQDIRIKWPNDLWLEDGRKLCGILIETASVAALGATSDTGTGAAARYVVIGVGLNIARPTVQDAANTPAGLCECDPHASAPDVLGRIVVPLVQAVQRFATTGFAPWLERYRARDALRGRHVLLSDGRHGWCQGVGADGALWVQFDHGPAQAITSAEVSVRPSPSSE